jgi:hypothetical protein
MRQAEAATDQPTTRKDVLHFLRSCARGHIEVFWNLAQQKIAHASPDDECFETRVLQVTNHFSRMRAKFLEPDPVLGLGNGDKLFDDDLRFVTG